MIHARAGWSSKYYPAKRNLLALDVVGLVLISLPLHFFIHLELKIPLPTQWVQRGNAFCGCPYLPRIPRAFSYILFLIRLFGSPAREFNFSKKMSLFFFSFLFLACVPSCSSIFRGKHFSIFFFFHLIRVCAREKRKKRCLVRDCVEEESSLPSVVKPGMNTQEEMAVYIVQRENEQREGLIRHAVLQVQCWHSGVWTIAAAEASSIGFSFLTKKGSFLRYAVEIPN